VTTEERALEAVGLFKRYGERRAVQGVDLVVEAGRVHGLLGPNGAGKTTLMRMLLGLARPDAGVVRLLGEAAGTPSRPLPAGVAGFVDTPCFYPYLSGRKNLSLLARLDGTSRSQASEKVVAALEQVSLTAHADARVAGYSAGMRQRLGLAAALMRCPRLLMLDEPTNSLDPAGARELSAQLRRLAQAGAAVLLSSHDMTEVENLCTTVTILHHGRVAFSGTVEDLRRQAPAAAHRLRTSDDEKALALATASPDVKVAVAVEGVGLECCASEAALDGYILALGQAGIATRGLEPMDRSLESMFLRLTSDSAGAGPPPPPSPPVPVDRPVPPPRAERGRVSARGVLIAAGVEHTKLRSQLKVGATLAVCLLGPFAFAVAMRVQSAVPEDTLFGRWAKASGFALPLVVLGFAALWAFPALTSVVAGDLFSAEDRYGTWPNLLTRSRTRGEIFAGKVLAGLTFSLAAACVLAVSSTAAGVLVIGRQPLVGLSGTLLPPGSLLGLTACAWLSILPPVFAFTMLALLLSARTRSGAAGIGLPVLIAFVMQLSSYVNGPSVIQRVLLTPPFVAWHGLFTEPRYYGPLLEGTATSGAYFVVCLAAAYLLLRRREPGTS
jgi:ABC-type multidrug transport system ATPase subunit/ABC-type transport system involved in multi-copper enzyme maturation permease subunit